MTSATASSELLAALQNKATQLRIESVRATSEAGSGHPSSCCSAADIVAALFFSVMRYDPKNPKTYNSDRFVLSKGHAAPLLYAAWAEAGLFPKSDLLKLRTLTSDLEGHPTPRLSFVDMATGSLGQGLPVGIGVALNAKYIDKLDHRTYVLMGDGESVEGSVWEAAEVARYYGLDNLCVIIDVNRLGQSDPTMLQHDMEGYRSRWAGFGWQALVVDGHDLSALLAAFDTAAGTKGKPTVLLAKTFKGKGLSFLENHPGWHGKPVAKGEETQKAIEELTKQLRPSSTVISVKKAATPAQGSSSISPLPPSPYKIGDPVATREAFGSALETLGSVNPLVVGLDADVKNSTYTDKFGKKFHRGAKYDRRRRRPRGLRQSSIRGDICLFPRQGIRFYPHGRDQWLEHQTCRHTCRREHWRRRPLADGAGRYCNDGGATGRDRIVSVGCDLYVSARRNSRCAQRDGLHSGRSPQVSGSIRA